MDVSGWTNQQRMRFPDWCFPEKQVISAYRSNNVPDTKTYGISEIALPDPICLWEVGWLILCEDVALFRFKIGLRDTVPTNEAEMNECQEILPYFGEPQTGPNYICGGPATRLSFIIPVRKSMVTGGKKLIVANENYGGVARFAAWMLVSGLPTSMAGWMAHNK